MLLHHSMYVRVIQVVLLEYLKLNKNHKKLIEVSIIHTLKLKDIKIIINIFLFSRNFKVALQNRWGNIKSCEFLYIVHSKMSEKVDSRNFFIISFTKNNILCKKCFIYEFSLEFSNKVGKVFGGIRGK